MRDSMLECLRTRCALSVRPLASRVLSWAGSFLLAGGEKATVGATCAEAPVIPLRPGFNDLIPEAAGT